LWAEPIDSSKQQIDGREDPNLPSAQTESIPAISYLVLQQFRQNESLPAALDVRYGTIAIYLERAEIALDAGA
jgi:hypothetical protein